MPAYDGTGRLVWWLLVIAVALAGYFGGLGVLNTMEQIRSQNGRIDALEREVVRLCANQAIVFNTLKIGEPRCEGMIR